MKRKTKITIIISAILVAVALGILCIDKFIIPIKIKSLVVNMLKERTGYDVTIKSMNYMPLSKIYLRDVILYDKSSSQQPLIKIKGLSFSFHIWPLLKEKSLSGRLGLKDLTYKTTKLNGFASILLKQRQHLARRPFLKNLDGVIKLVNFSFERNPFATRMENITGSIKLQDRVVSLEKTFFKYGNTIYTVEGALRDLDKDEPNAVIYLNSDIGRTEGTFILKDNHIEIKKIEGTLFGSSFNIMGDIKTPTATQLNLYGEAKIDLADLRKLIPKSKYISDSLKPAGVCDAVLFFNGALSNPKDSEVSLKLSSNKAFLHGLAFENLYLDLKMKDGIVNTNRLNMRLYLGFLTGSFSLDLNKEDLPYSISFALKDGNLAKFSADMNFGKEDMSGLISSKFFLKGSLNSINDLRGSGWITVVGGRLWEWPLLGGVADLLRFPNMRSVVFKEAAGNFIIDQRKISTDDLTFYSDEVNISAKGTVDFDGNIDLALQTHLAQDLIEGTSDAAKYANLLISQAGNYIGRIRITGTLKDPKHKFTAAPINKIFKKEIKGFLKDILR